MVSNLPLATLSSLARAVCCWVVRVLACSACLVGGVLGVVVSVAQAKTIKLSASLTFPAFPYSNGMACDAFAVIDFPAVRGPGGKEPAGISYTATVLNSGSPQSFLWSPSDDDFKGVTGEIRATSGEHQVVIGDNAGSGTCAQAIGGVSGRFTDPGATATIAMGHLLRGSVTNVDTKQPVVGATVEVSGTRNSRTQTDSAGRYALDLPKGHYSVRVVVPGRTFAQAATCHPGEVSGDNYDRCDVDLTRGDGVADFKVGEQVTVTFDPGTVVGDGLGFARIRVKVTDAAGHPLAGHTVRIDPPGGRVSPGSFLHAAGENIICGPGGPISPTSITTDSSGRPLGVWAENDPRLISTDASGTATAFVFAGQKVTGTSTVTGLPVTYGGDLTLSADDLRGNKVIGSSKSATLHLTPLPLPPAWGINPGTGSAPLSAPSPRLLASNIAGSADFVNASSAEVQNALLEELINLDARGIIGPEFSPVVAVSHGFVNRELAGVAFPREQTFSPGADQGGDERYQILDDQLATTISLPNPINLPGQLPTFKEWSDSHSSAFQSGQVFDGHFFPVDSDSITYFGTTPYPPADMRLRLIFDECVPGQNQATGIFGLTFSPLHLAFVDSHGNQFGVDAKGKRQLHIPGGLMLLGQHPAEYMVPQGNYTVRLTGTGSGSATLALYYPGRGAVQSTRVFTLQVRRGQTGVLRINSSHPAPTLRFGGRVYHATKGLGLRARGLPSRLRKGRKHTSLVRITDQTGRPAIDATITIIGRGFRAAGSTDNKGRVRLTLTGAPGGLKVTIRGLGYQTTHLRITVATH